MPQTLSQPVYICFFSSPESAGRVSARRLTVVRGYVRWWSFMESLTSVNHRRQQQ